MSKILQELQARKHKSHPVYITSCAVIVGVEQKVIFVGNTHKECVEKAQAIGIQSRVFQLGFLGTDGQFYSPSEAGLLAYKNRQTEKLCDPLQPEDILVTA